MTDEEAMLVYRLQSNLREQARLAKKAAEIVSELLGEGPCKTCKDDWRGIPLGKCGCCWEKCPECGRGG